jgi:cell division protein FtsN
LSGLATNEDGEFELLLGNRQLVSLFLIVVILLGVFFSMGYIVGRNSAASSPTADTASRAPDAAKPVVVENPSRPAAPRSETASAEGPAPKVEPKPEPPLPETHPPDVPRSSSPKPVERPVEPKLEKPSPTSARAVFEEPRPGQNFLQVVAAPRADAELVAETLMKKDFKARVAPGPNPTVFRVLVGPLKDAPDMAETRTRLEAAGFRPIVRRY